MNVNNTQQEEPFMAESKIEEVFMQEEDLGEIAEEIPNGSSLTNQVEVGVPKEVDVLGN